MKKHVGYVILLLFFVILALLLKGYSGAKTKSEEKIAELQAEIARLSDPVGASREASKEIMINATLQDGELVTAEYSYTDAGKFGDPKRLFGYAIPFTDKSFIAKWEGSVKAGIKIKKILIEINEKEKEIIVQLPPAEILSHETDAQSIEILNEKDGFLNPITIDDIRACTAVSQETMEQKAIENHLLEKANANAQDIILKFIGTVLKKEHGYRVVFKSADAF